MRADGSFKSLITGVATVPLSQQGDREYMQECYNMRNDQTDGLQRRGPALLVKDLLTTNNTDANVDILQFDPQVDVFKPFSIGNDDYWMYSNSDGTDKENYLVSVFNSEGVPVETFSHETQYMKNTAGNDDVRLTVSGDTVYVSNSIKEVEMVEDSAPASDKMSILSCKFSPTVYSQVVLKFNTPYSNTAIEFTYEIGQDHPHQPINDISDVDTGVNTIAFLIGEALDAFLTSLSVAGWYAGSIDVIRSPDSSSIGLRVNTNAGAALFGYDEPSPFVGLTISDGSGGAFVAVDESVTAVNDLPRDFLPNAIVAVRPDPESGAGQYYMKAIPKDAGLLPATLPTPASVIHAAPATAPQPNVKYQTVSGHWYSYDGIEHGFNTVATSLEPFPVDYPGTLSLEQYLTSDTGDADAASTTFVYRTVSPFGTGQIPGSFMKEVTFWRRQGTASTGAGTAGYEFTRVFSTAMYKSTDNAKWGGLDDINTWVGTIDAGIVLEPEDIYYIWFGNPIDLVGQRMTQVEWIECSHPEENAMIDADTFPHILHRQEDGTFVFGSLNQVSTTASPSMRPREAGDNKTNPQPAFIDKTIRDISVHQNRLAILTADKVSFSVSGQPNDWWRGTATQLLATSPIDIQSTSSAAGDLRSFVVHNNDLMVFGPYGQFRFSGQKALTPQNAALPQASSYPSTSVARPISAGNNVYFPTTYGVGAGLSQFSLDPQIQNLSVAKPMADKQLGLMQTDISQILSNPNLGIVINRVAGFGHIMYPMEFLPNVDILKQTESTWATWAFQWGVRIVSMRITDANLEFIGTGVQGNTQPRLYRLPLHTQKPASSLFNIVPREVFLDVRVLSEAVTTSLTLSDHYPTHPANGLGYPDRDVTIVQGPGCPAQGTVVPYTQVGNVLTFADMGGGQVYYGYEYPSRITLPKIQTRDKAGVRMTEAKKRLNAIVVSVEGSCGVTVNFGMAQTHIGGEAVQDVRFQAKVKDDALLTVASYGHHNMDLNQIEWTGTYYKAGRRF